MRKVLLGPVALLAFGIAGPANAADMVPIYKKAPPPRWSWEGFYVGFHSGAMFSGNRFSDPFGSSLYGDVTDVPGALAGAQAGYNWIVSPGWVAGLEADGSFVGSDGTDTCLQFSPGFVGSNCKVSVRAMGTLTGRLGFTVGPADRTLIYGKGGLAWVRDHVEAQGNNNFFGMFPQSVTSESFTEWGWTAGVGVEHALTPAWSLKLEYDYLRFANHGVPTPTSIVGTPATAISTVIDPNTSTVAQDAHVFKVGLNYHWAADPVAGWPAAAPAYPVKAIYKAPPTPTWAAGWEVEVGARYWVSSGKFQWDNFFVPSVLESRLTYNKLNANSGEIFGRIDTPANVFVKGFVGLGSITGGRMNDEDWGLTDRGVFTGYTNTLSDPVKGPIGYATIDVGYDLNRGPGYKAGPFIGYNYFKETLNAYNCAQTANAASGICAPPVPAGTLTISETSKWQSLRVGYAGEVMVTDRVKLTGEVAYLPYVSFDGRDDHWLRPGTFFTQWSRGGQGVQTELLLSLIHI